MRIEEATGSAPPSSGSEQRLPGLAVSSGIAIGPAHIVQSGDLPVAANRDIRAFGRRLIPNLIKKPTGAYSEAREGAVILAEARTPADTALIDPEPVAGFGVVSGGAESHPAIVARALGLPAVLAVPGLLDCAQAGGTAVVCGIRGCRVYVPSAPARPAHHARPPPGPPTTP